VAIFCSVDSLCFEFPDNWIVAKFDEWVFYRRHFSKMGDHIAAVDIVAMDPERTLYLIEAKDYRRHKREDPKPIQDILVSKMTGTLSALLPASLNATNSEERDKAKEFVLPKKIRVVFHLEQPEKRSRLFPWSYDKANLVDILKKRVKPIDAHPWVRDGADMASRHDLWSVRDA